MVFLGVNMNHAFIILIIFVLVSLSLALNAVGTGKLVIHVFSKNKRPSQEALKQINAAIDKHREYYDIRYHDIEDEANLELIHSLGLPSSHFPVAVVIDGKFTAQMGDRISSFVHFPDFMHGIGRHEGNWSISDLEAVLQDNSLLLTENILPELEEDETEGDCE